MAYGDLTRIHASIELVSTGGLFNLHILFFEFLLRVSNPKKWGDHQKKKYPLEPKNNEIMFEEAFPNQLKSFGGSLNSSNGEEMGRQKKEQVL